MKIVAVLVIPLIAVGLVVDAQTTLDPRLTYAMRQDSHFQSGTRWQLAVKPGSAAPVYAVIRPDNDIQVDSHFSHVQQPDRRDDPPAVVETPSRGYLPVRDVPATGYLPSRH